jgi:uncharacterized membrane protein YccC
MIRQQQSVVLRRRPKTLPFTLNPSAVSLAEGLRAGIAVALTVIAGAVFHLPHFGLAALGALLTCFADPGGPLPRRIPAVVAFAIASGLTYAVFGLIRADGVWLAAPAAGLMIFSACYARIYGQGGLQVGNLLSVVTVLALDRPVPGLAAAAALGLNFSAGAAWAALLTLAIWQIHPYAPARQAVADVAQKLGQLARDLAALAEAEESVAAFEAHAARHRRGVREAIEAARLVARATFRRRGLVSRRAAQLTVRLAALEQVFADLIALSDILESEPASRAPASRPIRLIAGWLAALGPGLIADRSLDTPKKRASLARLRAALAALPADGALRHVLEALAEHLAVLMTVSSPAGQALSGLAVTSLPLRQQILSPLRQNFNVSSAPMRHALRAALIATPVLAWTMSVRQPLAHWATIAMVLCLQPYFSATWLRAAERIAGTALGGVAAALVGLVAQTQLALALAMLPLTVFAFAIRGVSYGAFTAALTPMIVLLIEQIAPGADPLHVALLRVLYTLLGGTLAVAGNLLLWPDFEGARVEASMAAAIAAHAAYAQAVFAAVLDGGPPPDTARRAAGMASNNFEASLSRALLEPHRGRDAVIERGAIVDAALRRMAGRLSLLALDRPAIPPVARPLWAEWAAWIAAGLAGTPAPRPPLPAGPGGETLTRLARQIELIVAPAG